MNAIVMSRDSYERGPGSQDHHQCPRDDGVPPSTNAHPGRRDLDFGTVSISQVIVVT